jgi:predicted nucleotidyltransferase
MTVKESKLRKIFEKYRVKLAYLFGSQQESGLNFLKKGEKNILKNSDLDIGVFLNKIPSDMYKFYGDLYHDLSDLFEPFQVDIIFLNEVNHLLKFEIIKGHRIFAESSNFADDYEESVMKIAADLNFKRKMFEEDFLEALKNGYIEIELE